MGKELTQEKVTNTKQTEVDQKPSTYDEAVECETEQTLSDDEQVLKNTHVKRVRSLQVMILLLLLILGGIGYQLYPSVTKLAGTWTAVTDRNMSIVTKGKLSELHLANFSGEKNIEAVFKGTLVAKNMTQYRLTNVEGYLVIDISAYAAKDVAALKETPDLCTVEKETKTVLELKYTANGLKALMGTDKLDRYFNYSLEKGTLYLNNAKFSEKRIDFVKKKK